MKRKAVQGEKRANLHAGGTGEFVSLDYATKKIAVKASKTMGIGICAVDLIQSGQDSLVLEVNLSPGLQGITKASGINVADHIAEYLFKETEKFREGKKEQTEEILAGLDITSEEGLKDMIMLLQFRGKRILLPEMITAVTKFNEEEEVLINAEQNQLSIKKMK